MTRREIAGLFGMALGSSASRPASVLKKRPTAEPVPSTRPATPEVGVNRYFKG